MLRNLIFILSSFLIFFSCKQEKIVEVVELPVLRASNILKDDSVYAYLNTYHEKHKATAESYMEKAKELNDSDLKKAIYSIRRAITLYPNYTYYSELGKYLLENDSYEEARKVYSFICFKGYFNQSGKFTNDYIFQKPEEEDYYNLIVSQLLANERRFNSYLAHYGKELGFDMNAMKEKISEDKKVNWDKNSIRYKNFLYAFMNESEVEEFKKSETFFRDFLAAIPDSSQSFEINIKNVQAFKYNRMYNFEEEGDYDITSLYIHFLKEKQDNPNKWFDYNLTHVFPISDSTTAVIYAVDTSELACPVDMRHIYHHLVTYNAKGEIVDDFIVAYQSGEELVMAKFEKNRFVRSEYSRHWRDPYEKKNFDNEVIKTDFVGEMEFLIQPDGMILQSETSEEEEVSSAENLSESM